MRQGVRRAAVMTAALLTVACVQRSTSDRAGEGGSSAEPFQCEQTLVAPDGYSHTSATPIPTPEIIGIRESFRGPGGRGLHLSTGVAGEFGEGAATVEELTLASGTRAHLYGAGAVWVLTWDEGGTCGELAVVGSKFDHASFLELLSRMGLL